MVVQIEIKAISASNLKLRSKLSLARLCLKEEAIVGTQAKGCAGK